MIAHLSRCYRCLINHIGHSNEKLSSNMRIICRIRSSCACTKYHLYLCLPFIHSVISNDFVGGHWRPWSMQTDLGLCCLHMPRDVFMWHGPYDSTPIKVLQMLDWSITAVDYLLHTPTYMHWGKSASQQTNCDHHGDWFSFPIQEVLWLKQKSLGPVVLNIVSLARLLVVKMLAVLVNTISNSQVFLLKKIWVAFAKATHIFWAKILQYLMIKGLTVR